MLPEGMNCLFAFRMTVLNCLTAASVVEYVCMLNDWSWSSIAEVNSVQRAFL